MSKEQEIIKCANKIKNYCDDIDAGCVGCKFDKEDSCSLKGIPIEWEIPKLKPKLTDKDNTLLTRENNALEDIFKVIHKMRVDAMNDKELILSEWFEMDGEIIGKIIHEKYSFEDVKKKLGEYKVLKDKDTPKKPINKTK